MFRPFSTVGSDLLVSVAARLVSAVVPTRERETSSGAENLQNRQKTVRLIYKLFCAIKLHAVFYCVSQLKASYKY